VGVFTARAAGAVALLAITGLPWATTMTVPWALMGAAVTHAAGADGAPASAGVYATLFNLSQCFPEIAARLDTARVEATLVLSYVYVLTAAASVVTT